MTTPASARLARTDPRPSLHPSRLFAGQRFVVVGGTGFLGKVWISMLLHRFPELGHVYLMVRPKGDQSPEARFWAEIAPSPVFDPIREQHPGAAFEAHLRDKITPVAGDVALPLLGLDEALVAELRGRCAAVVNVAGVVDFDPPLDEALDVNAFGVNNLIALAQALDAPVMHTSTCYVAGYRTGLIEEVDPRDVPFPRADGAPRGKLVSKPEGIPVDRKLERSHWDPQNEIAECLDVIESTRHRCEDQFRQSLFLDEAKRRLRERGEPCRGRALEDELADVKRRFVRDRLIEAGQERALYWGWPNIYTYTKSIGEQVLAASGVPFTIVRPAVVESASFYPFPGWNEGINTSAPYIYLALKGQVQFPNVDEVHLDIIPVDMVCSGMIAALAELVAGDHRAVYQYGQTDTNPCSMPRYMELIGLYKRKKLQDGGESGNRLLNAVLARFEPVSLNKEQYRAHGAHAIADAERKLADLIDAVGVGPAAQWLAPASKALRRAARTEDKLGDVIDLFIPFVVECDWIFSCANTRAALARMPEEERSRFIWEPEKIDWRQWMYEVHIPGIEKWAGPLFEERLKRELKPTRRYDHLLDLLDEMAERYDHQVALRYLEDDGLSRVTFIEWREMAASCAGRLYELGVRPGDRVVLSGYNHPAWPIAYFGILRAGAVAVPVDPTLSAPQFANIIRSSGAAAIVWGPEVERAIGPDLRASVAADVPCLDLHRATEDDRSIVAPPVDLKGSDLASVIYTSGTTGEPKGVMLSHDNLTSLLSAIQPLFFLEPKDGVLSVLPLHHTFEFSCGLLLPMSRGATVSYIGELTAERLNDGLDRGKITGMVGVPALWQMLERRLVDRVKERGPLAARYFDFALELNRLLGRRLGVDAGKLFFGPVHAKLGGGSVKYLISGGSALPKRTAEVFAGLGLKLTEGYGLTEAAPVLTVARPTPKSRTGQVGKAIPGVELKIGAPNDDGVGEVLARGPNVMKGYFEDRDATAAVIDDDGWLHTGDLGRFDKRGQLVLVGRQKEVIVTTSGENVYPDDVEDLLGPVDHIDELAVVGIPKDENEAVACIAVPRSVAGEARGLVHARALTSLREQIRRKLPRVAQPTVIHLYDADLPKTATRKVKRTEVRDIIVRLERASEPPRIDGKRARGALAVAQHAVASLASRRPEEILPQLSLRSDLGFDSLMAMELTVALESQAGHPLDGTALARVETVADVAALLGPARRSAIERAVGEDRSGRDEPPLELPGPVRDTAKRWLTRAQMGFYGRVMKPTVFGRAHIPHNRNAIVVSNHVSHLDMGFVKYALGPYGDEIVSLAAADYFFEGRWKRAYFEQLTNLQAFDRETNLRQALRESGETISSGRTVLMFPEGTRSKDGQVNEFKATMGHLALSTRTDVLPVFLRGTYESWPKGRRVPTRREISAHIGPPLRIEDLERLTDGMKFRAACRAVARLARQAVVALQRGGVLDLAMANTLEEALGEKKVHPLVRLFDGLPKRFVAGKVDKEVVFYFTLGAEPEAKWTARVGPEDCAIEPGKPQNGGADCVLKTTSDIFIKMVNEAYMPTPVEVMSGLVKSNDVALLATFQEAFGIR
ncbi:MAG: AMP-binding protein [Myxococcota bacterium]